MVYFTTSWDDGNKLDTKIACLLKEYGFDGTFYIPIKYEMRTLKDVQIKKISKNFEIGSHGLSHKILTHLEKKTAEVELISSKKILAGIIRRSVSSYAYPFGKFNKISAVYVRNAGYKFARTSDEFSLNAGDPFMSKITLRASNNFSKFLHLKFLHLLVKSDFKWDKLAKIIFKNCVRTSIFHLTGHSYDLKKENFEEELIDFFDYVKKFDFMPITNSQILKVIAR